MNDLEPGQLEQVFAALFVKSASGPVVLTTLRRRFMRATTFESVREDDRRAGQREVIEFIDSMIERGSENV